MSATRVIGVVLVVAGAFLVILGIRDSRSLADNLSTTFLGHLTRNTFLYILGGAASVLVGIVLARDSAGRGKA
jgi:hypothetical protein